MAAMQWIGMFFSLNWLEASAAIFCILALGAGIVSLWQRLTGSSIFDRYAEGTEDAMSSQRRVA
jgi:hypothetical protein